MNLRDNHEVGEGSGAFVCSRTRVNGRCRDKVTSACGGRRRRCTRVVISWLLLHLGPPRDIGLKAPQCITEIEPQDNGGALLHASVLRRQRPPRYAIALCVGDNTAHRSCTYVYGPDCEKNMCGSVRTKIQIMRATNGRDEDKYSKSEKGILRWYVVYSVSKVKLCREPKTSAFRRM